MRGYVRHLYFVLNIKIFRASIDAAIYNISRFSSARQFSRIYRSVFEKCENMRAYEIPVIYIPGNNKSTNSCSLLKNRAHDSRPFSSKFIEILLKVRGSLCSSKIKYYVWSTTYSCFTKRSRNTVKFKNV